VSSNFFFFSSRRRHTRLQGDWSSDVCSSDLLQCSSGRITTLRELTLIVKFLFLKYRSGKECLKTGFSWVFTSLWQNVSHFRFSRSEERRVGKECRFRRLSVK